MINVITTFFVVAHNSKEPRPSAAARGTPWLYFSSFIPIRACIAQSHRPLRRHAAQDSRQIRLDLIS